MPAGPRMDGLLALDLWDVVIEVLRSTTNSKRPIRPAPGYWRGTPNHSSNRTKNKTPAEKSNQVVDQLSNVDHVPTNTHSSQGESISVVHFGRQRSCDPDDHKGKKSNDETRVQNPQSRT